MKRLFPYLILKPTDDCKMNADVKLNVPKIGHTQIRNDTFPEQASSVSGLGAPHLLRSLRPSFAPPVCVRPPRLRSPSFPHRQGVPKVSWPSPFPGPPHAHTPFVQVAPLAWPPPLCSPHRVPPFPCPLPASHKWRDSAPAQSLPPGLRHPSPQFTHPTPPTRPPPLRACWGVQEG